MKIEDFSVSFIFGTDYMGFRRRDGIVKENRFYNNVDFTSNQHVEIGIQHSTS